jgi:hypothetical protein
MSLVEGLSVPRRTRPTFRSKLIQQYYQRTRRLRHFIDRLRIAYQAFKNYDRLYGRGLVVSLEFEGSFSFGSAGSVTSVSAHILQKDGSLRKPVVFP